MKQKIGLWILYYLRWLARIQLSKFQPEIIGITGSAGKTTTQQALTTLLSAHYVVKTSLKANSESGIPLDILGISPHSYSPFDWLRMLILAPLMVVFNWKRYDTYIAEMGIDSPYPPKNMGYLLTIIKPSVGICLNALPVHAAMFDGLVKESSPRIRRQKIIDLIAREKGKLLTSLSRKGLAVVNADDPAVMRQTRHIRARLMTFGRSTSSEVILEQIHYSKSGTRINFRYEHQAGAVVFPAYLPIHFGLSLAAALTVYVAKGYLLTDGCQRLTNQFVLPPGRMSVFAGIRGSTIIDSSYNASAVPTMDALSMMAELPAKRRIALLGDMRELGAEAEAEHLKVMAVVIKRVDKVYLVGSLMKEYAIPYLKQHRFPFEWYPTAIEAGKALQEYVIAGDFIFVKGSQNRLYLETAVAMLLANKKDEAKLCRRGKYWDKLRKRKL